MTIGELSKIIRNMNSDCEIKIRFTGYQDDNELYDIDEVLEEKYLYPMTREDDSQKLILVVNN